MKIPCPVLRDHMNQRTGQEPVGFHGILPPEMRPKRQQELSWRVRGDTRWPPAELTPQQVWVLVTEDLMQPPRGVSPCLEQYISSEGKIFVGMNDNNNKRFYLPVSLFNQYLQGLI